jgi:hypothetical protein
MAAPTQITVTYLVYSGASPAVITTASTVIPVPTILQNLDSSTAGVNQTGFNAFDSLLTGIAKRGGISFTTAAGVQTFIPLTDVVSITSP